MVSASSSRFHPADRPQFIRMAERGIPQRELAACFGSQPNCSAVLNRRRGLTLPMIRGLHEKLGIPADLLIRECRRRRQAQTRARP